MSSYGPPNYLRQRRFYIVPFSPPALWRSRGVTHGSILLLSLILISYNITPYPSISITQTQLKVHFHHLSYVLDCVGTNN
jgi:hypothetical protein